MRTVPNLATILFRSGLFFTYAAAPPPGSRSTCCRICRCQSRFRAWCHLFKYSVPGLHFQAFLISYQCSISQDPGSVEASSRAGCVMVGHTCIWWPKSCEELAVAQCAQELAIVSNLQANAAQVAQSTQDSRHGCKWCCARAMACSRARLGCAVEASTSRRKRGSSLAIFLAELLTEQDEDGNTRFLLRKYNVTDDSKTCLALLAASAVALYATTGLEVWSRATKILEHVQRACCSNTVVRCAYSEHHK